MVSVFTCEEQKTCLRDIAHQMITENQREAKIYKTCETDIKKNCFEEPEYDQIVLDDLMNTKWLTV